MNRLFPAALLMPLAVLASSCDQQPEGEPVVRAEIRDTSGNAAGASPTPASSDGRAQVESSCRPVIFENEPFVHCVAVPSRHHITTALADGEGTPFRSLAAYASARSAEAAPIAFAMNGGMYDDAGQPVGYFVEGSDRKVELNRNDGPGNFHMQPNGVFFGSGDTWEVRSTEDFLANVTERPEFGTQSGPMLVIGGKLHPDISNDGESQLIRNAVGVDEKGRAHFVISNGPVSFGKLARLYRDELNVPNALYLDGNVSALWNPARGRLDTGAPIGPIIVVEKKPAS